MGESKVQQCLEEVKEGLANLRAVLEAVQRETDANVAKLARKLLREKDAELQVLFDKLHNHVAEIYEDIADSVS